MYLKTLVVKNFRTLEDIEVTFDHRVNVIVGPNAIGKTTLLEAVRLAKALLAPRTQNETNQILFSLGAATPYNPQRLIADAIANDQSKSVVIRCTFELSSTEIGILESALSQIASNLMLENMGRGFAGVGETIAALSSPGGVQAHSAIAQALRSDLANIKAGKRECKLELVIDPIQGLSSVDQTGAVFIAFLDRRLPPSITIFSYFPADRAIPSQEQPVQIGAADAATQIESHNSQPQLKYQRLKNTIFNAVISSEDGRKQITSDFGRIFERILKGRRLAGVGVNEHGMLMIGVEDIESGKRFAVDAMSSGEKGLILTFLLMAKSICEGGLVLIDEPELHLNPAVCKDLLDCLVDDYALAGNFQMLVCSHSPEILGRAFEREDCALYHLRSGNLLTPVRKQDHDEVDAALRILGTSQGEGLLYKATVFVEGEQDSEVLNAGFDKLLRRYKLKDLGGRREIEKAILTLQEAEARGTTVASQFFIFDRDEAPTGLKNSKSVKILQWGRRCLENYLLDVDVLTDLLKSSEFANHPVKNVGELQSLLKELALSQLDELAAKEVYAEYSFESPGLRKAEIQNKNLEEIGSLLFSRLHLLKTQVCTIDEPIWKSKFLEDCAKRRLSVQSLWDAKWREECDGKRLFSDLQRKVGIKSSLPRFKRRVITDMRNMASENWRTMESLLKELIS